MTTTQVSGSQINRRWNIASGIGLAIVGVATIGQSFVTLNHAGVTTSKDFTNGSREQSGSLLVQTGSITTLFANSITGRVGIRTRAPKAVFEVVGSMSGNTMYIARAFSGAGLTDCQNATTSKLLYNLSTGRFSCGSDTDANTTYTASNGLTLNGTAFALSSTITGSALRINGTVSGSLLVLSSMRNCTLKTSGTGSALCGTDLNTQFSNTGSLQGAFDNRYVRKSGSTVTGSLIVQSSLSGSGFFTLSRYRGCTLKSSATGAVICGTDLTGAGGNWSNTGSLQSAFDSRYLRTAGGSMTGNLLVKATISGSALRIDNLKSCSKVITDSLGNQSCGTDANTTYTAAQGLTLVGTAFSLYPTLTGSSLKVTGTLSGALLVLSNMHGCTLKTSGSGNVLCGSDNNTTYTAANGLNLNGTAFGLNAALSGTSLSVYGTMSGRLITQNGAGLNYLLGSVGIGKTNPVTPLEVKGTISGSTVVATVISGALLRSGHQSPSPTTIELIPTGTGTAITTGSGRIRYTVPKTMSGFRVYDATFTVDTAGATNATSIQIRDLQKGNRKIFSTPPQVDSGTKSSDVSGTPFVINAANADVSGGDYLYVDFPAVSTTAPKGANLILLLYRP